jgi:hypothetical protein
MVSHTKSAMGVFLLLFAAQLPAQSPKRWGECEDIAVIVRDPGGAAIIGATVVTENGVMQLLTDSKGYAAIPCSRMSGIPQILKVAAPGYHSASMPLTSNMSSHFEVILDRSALSVPQSGGTTISAAELRADVQAKSSHLQEEARKALAHQDYNNAEKLLKEALELTPSSPMIANNLGVVALRRKDLDSAGAWFQKAAEVAPYTSDILGNLGLVRWMQHRFEESYRILTKALSLGYESGMAHYILGELDLENGRSEEAANHLKKVPIGRFSYRDLYLSIALRNCGKTKAADESYRNFIRRHPAPYLISQLSR